MDSPEVRWEVPEIILMLGPKQALGLLGLLGPRDQMGPFMILGPQNQHGNGQKPRQTIQQLELQ